VKNLQIYLAVLLYAGCIMAKVKESHVKNGPDSSQHKAIIFAGKIVTSANIVG
jgi:hypothetical protein